MNQTEKEKQAHREAMKGLRQKREKTIAVAKAKVKAQGAIIKVIKRLLKEGARTVPEISESVAISPSETLWYIMSLKKYGQVVEGEQDGSYFRYELAEKAVKGGEG